MNFNPQYFYYLQWLFRIFLGGLLIFAGVMKLQNGVALFETITYITWLPVWLKWVIIDTLPWAEVVTGTLLFVPILDRVALPLTALFYTGFLGFSIYGLATGMEGDCGCFGDMAGSSFGWGMIIRNALFTGMAGILFLDGSRFAKERSGEMAGGDRLESP